MTSPSETPDKDALQQAIEEIDDLLIELANDRENYGARSWPFKYDGVTRGEVMAKVRELRSHFISTLTEQEVEAVIETKIQPLLMAGTDYEIGKLTHVRHTGEVRYDGRQVYVRREKS